MDSLDDLLNFSSDVDDLSGVSDPDDPSRPLLPAPEEELEWLSNKDAFPPVETIADILSEQPGGIGIGLVKQQSPVSVLDSSTLKPPHKARSKSRRRRRACAGFPDIPAQPLIWNQANNPTKNGSAKAEPMATTMGRKCQHCGAEKTPQWRAGPLGPKTLCNACGVRYKSGRLVPEYRPASSPTFSSELHSNSHRKVMEMRKQKYGMGAVVKPVDKG